MNDQEYLLPIPFYVERFIMRYLLDEKCDSTIYRVALVCKRWYNMVVDNQVIYIDSIPQLERLLLNTISPMNQSYTSSIQTNIIPTTIYFNFKERKGKKNKKQNNNNNHQGQGLYHDLYHYNHILNNKNNNNIYSLIEENNTSVTELLESVENIHCIVNNDADLNLFNYLLSGGKRVSSINKKYNNNFKLDNHCNTNYKTSNKFLPSLKSLSLTFNSSSTCHITDVFDSVSQGGITLTSLKLMKCSPDIFFNQSSIFCQDSLVKLCLETDSSFLSLNNIYDILTRWRNIESLCIISPNTIVDKAFMGLLCYSISSHSSLISLTLDLFNCERIGDTDIDQFKQLQIAHVGLVESVKSNKRIIEYSLPSPRLYCESRTVYVPKKKFIRMRSPLCFEVKYH